MMKLDVIPMDSRDAKGRARFFPFWPGMHVNLDEYNEFWAWTNAYYPPQLVCFMFSLPQKPYTEVVSPNSFKIVYNRVFLTGLRLLFRHPNRLPLHIPSFHAILGICLLPCKLVVCIN